MRRFGNPPSADEMEAIARRALDSLPEPFADHLRDVVLLIEDFADDETLSAMGIEEAFDLTGIYEGIPITERSVDHSGTLPDRIRLFRRPILDEWADGDDTLEHLVAHVLIHEVGHHFGLSDEATLSEMGIEDPFELTGLYHGLPVGDKSVEHSGMLPDRIFLYRRAILDEWAAEGESLEHLVHHILVHEVGHHFGLSDEAMHALEDEA